MNARRMLAVLGWVAATARSFVDCYRIDPRSGLTWSEVRRRETARYQADIDAAIRFKERKWTRWM